GRLDGFVAGRVAAAGSEPRGRLRRRRLPRGGGARRRGPAGHPGTDPEASPKPAGAAHGGGGRQSGAGDVARTRTEELLVELHAGGSERDPPGAPVRKRAGRGP